MRLRQFKVNAIEFEDNIELEIIKEALDNLHKKLSPQCEDTVGNKPVVEKTMRLEHMCQSLGMEGYEFS